MTTPRRDPVLARALAQALAASGEPSAERVLAVQFWSPSRATEGPLNPATVLPLRRSRT